MYIKKRVLVIFAYALLLLPISVFLVSWLKLWIGIPALLILVAGTVWLVRKDYSGAQSSLTMPIGHLIGIVALFGVVVALSGIAGIGVSGYDVPWRNAIFHDLIDYSWPVIYDNGNALVYYCTFWLPAALVGKLFGWISGLIALWVYALAIITVSYLLVMLYLDISTPGKLWLGALFVVFWSGMTFLGAAIMSVLGWNLYDYRLLTDGTSYCDGFFNGESFNWVYRSNFITLQMTYNQLLLWLAVPLMLMNRKAHSYLHLGLLVMPYSPWGFIGIIPLLVVCAWPDMASKLKKKQVKEFFLSLFSPANVAAVVVLVPIFALYFLVSTRAGGAASASIISADQVAAAQAAGLPYTTQTGVFGFLSFDRFDYRNLCALFIFYLIEFGAYMALIRPKYRRKPLFIAVFVVLLMVPLMWVGTIGGRDFCMNGSLPALYVLMILTLAYVKDELCGKALGVRGLCLIIALFLGFIGPVYSMFGRMQAMKEEHSLTIIDDHIRTLSDKSLQDYSNFIIENPENTPFFKYIAR